MGQGRLEIAISLPAGPPGPDDPINISSAGRCCRCVCLLHSSRYDRCPESAALQPSSDMHYPHKTSKIKRIRKVGFRRRMKTSKGRRIVNRQRALGRKVGAR